MKLKKKSLTIIGIIIIFLVACFILIYENMGKTSDFKVIDESKKIEEAAKFGDDVTGWLRVEGTNIDLPLIARNNVADVSRRDYEYAWTNSFPDDKSNHFTYISHNIRNVSSNPIIGDDSMTYFEQLMSFIYPDFIKDNQFIEFTYPNGKTTTFRIYGVSLIKDNQELSYYDTFNDKELNDYIKQVKKESMYDIDVDVDSSDMLLTLYTCTRFYGGNAYSFRVDARELREGEKMKYSTVEVNNNYKEIEERMKEGEKNEKA